MASLLSLLTVLTVAQPPTPNTSYKPPVPLLPPPGLLMSAVIFPQTFGGAYVISIGVGTPPVNQLMIIDTGSDITWFQCKPCNCYQMPGVFDPLNSTSISVVPCDSSACNQLQRHSCSKSQCQYEVDYLDNSFTNGSLVLETLTFGSTAVLNVLTGCGHSNFGFMLGAHGLVGLGGGPLSLATQLRVHGRAGIFSYCLPNLHGGLLGWLNFSLPNVVLPTGTAWIPLVRTTKIKTHYHVELSGLGIGNMQLPIPQNSFKGGAIIDSGTTYTYLPRLVYEAIRNAYLAKTVNLPRAPATSLFDTCYNLSGLESVQVPNVSFFFSAGPILTLQMWNILVEQERYVGERIFCFAFIPTSDVTSIIGNTQLAGIQTSFDAEAGYVGFGPSICGPPESSPHCHGHWPPRRSIALENYIPPNPLFLCLFTCFYVLIISILD
ncbi:protein ASPARTIC PROTEASE IN GUARD CELL 2-like [Corylus avellana]|uniref:protein ASPARTIC PROTEASE IN GUARD CELL 2-like n=1 Tax=Corylus avellana TaxID=13451 RepID=UPI00286A20B9|nr:protein ASPARTIC PROTEASE IN GUARD CELL 2-like [Corylus avellana]